MSSSPKSRIPTLAEFWKLVAQSGLFNAEQCRELHTRYTQEGTASSAEPTKSLAKWLIERKYLTLYQAQILIAGRPGPFLYGAYKLLDRMEEGGLKGCFRAVHRETRLPVLLQFFAGEVAEQASVWSAFTPWLDAACALNHPNLHRWFEWVDLDEFKFLVSEDISGTSLDEFVRGERCGIARACWLTQQVARGVAVLHQQGWCHGQLRPGTVWTTPSHVAKVLLHPLTEATQLRRPAELVAADYAAPELALPGRTPTPTSDVYALGCIFYELLSGHAPFSGETLEEKRKQHASDPIQALSRRKVPPEIEHVVARMMAKNPPARCQSMEEVVTKLEPFVKDEPHLMPPSLPDRALAAYEATLTRAAPPQRAPDLPTFPSPRDHSSVRRSHSSSGRRSRTSTPIFPPQHPEPDFVVAAPRPIPQTAPSRPAPEVVKPAQDALQQIADQERSKSRGKPSTKPRGSLSRRYRLAGGLAGTLLLVCGLALVLTNLFSGTRGTPESPASPIGVAQSPEASVPPLGERSSPSGAIPDDGESLWASPTSGLPLDLRGVPPDSMLTIALRPSAIRQTAEGERTLQALGPAWREWEEAFLQSTKISLDDIERLVVGVHRSESDATRASYSIRLSQPLPLSQLLTLWGNPSEASEEGETYYVQNQHAYYCWEAESSAAAEVPNNSAARESRLTAGETEPPATNGPMIRSFAWGHVEEMILVAQRKGAPPATHIGTEGLLQATDRQRLVTILFAPQFWRSHLLRDGREFYFGSPERLRAILEWLLGDGWRAGTMSLHLSDEALYLETQLAIQELRTRYQFATMLGQRLKQLPDLAETYIARDILPPEYWRRVAFRYPLMLQFLLDHTRVHVEDNRVVLNALLPAVAAHNMIFASEILLATQPGTPPADRSTQPASPTTLDEVLQEKISLRFDQLALESALAAVTSDVRDSYPRLPFDFEVKIVGEDFEKGGITRNQQIVNFQQRDVTVAEVLTALVRQANPITTVKDPSEPDQKLIWVVAPDPDQPSRTIVLLTTRDGAEARKWTLPRVFRSPE